MSFKLAFPLNGTRQEIVEQIIETGEAWGMPMTREQAEEKADAAIAAERRPWWLPYALGGALIGLMILMR